MLMYNRQAMHGSLPLHGKSILFGLLIVGALGALLNRPAKEPYVPVYDLSVEHDSPLQLTLELTSKHNAGRLELTIKSDTGAILGIPVAWQRTQVKNVPLASVTEGEAAVGLRRWHVPANATVIYDYEAPIAGIQILNPTKQPMEVRYRHIDLVTGEKQERSALFSESAVTVP